MWTKLIGFNHETEHSALPCSCSWLAIPDSGLLVAKNGGHRKGLKSIIDLTSETHSSEKVG